MRNIFIPRNIKKLVYVYQRDWGRMSLFFNGSYVSGAYVDDFACYNTYRNIWDIVEIEDLDEVDYL